MKRLFDIIISVLLLLTLFLPMVLIFIAIKATSEGKAIYWSERVGKNNLNFQMPKFRTMHINSPEVASHLLENAHNFYTPLGLILRKYSLDELPQLITILLGHMSFVGPRPSLYNQHDLITLRNQKEVSKLKPGITGWAQVNGRDELSILEKVQYDEEYLKRASMSFDIYIIWLTIIKVIKKDGVSH